MSTGHDHTSPAAETLDKRVDELLDRLERGGSESAGEEPTEPEPAGARAEQALAHVEENLGELLEQVSAEVQPREATSGPVAAETSEAANPEVAVPVEEEPAAPGMSLEMLDAELAKLASQLVDSDFDATPEAPGPQPSGEPRHPAAPPPSPPVHREPADAVPDPAPSPPPSARPSLRGGLAAAVGLAGTAGRAASPVVLRAARVVSRPLDARPPIVRDAVGWCALVTAFWAIVVWTYILIFRKPNVPRPTEAPVVISTPQTDHEAMVRAAEAAVRAKAAEGEDGHGASKGGGGHGADKPKDAHGGGHGPAKDPHATPSGGH